MIRSLLCLSLCLSSAAAYAQPWARETLEKSPRHGEWVKIKSGDRDIDAFVVYPEKAKRAAAVIVIHEIFGLTDWVRSVADRLAESGYVAVAPDLLSGKGPDGGRTDTFATVEAAREAVSKLDPAAVAADLGAVADYIKSVAGSNGKLAVAGFCWGGARSFEFAGHRKDLGATFVFYGAGPADVSTVGAPVYAFYAENDARINAKVVDTKRAMKAAKKKFEPLVYEGAGHGFMRQGEDPANAVEANKKARDMAWARWLSLLKRL